MTTLEQIQAQVQALSAPLQQEVLDFVEYLRLKQTLSEGSRTQQDAAWTKEMRALVEEFRQSAAGYSADEIDQIVDEAVEAVRRESNQRQPKARR
jgi:hypothetical protein